MTHSLSLTLDRLTLWSGNVRRTDASSGIAELTDSIMAHGLLQSLVVRKAKRGKYEVIAGQRRYLALSQLAKQKRIAADYEISCTLASDELEPTELSLAENIMRAPMHPADQYEAFRDIIDKGASVADVAARFSVSERVVSQRLKLGRLSPVIMAAYREERLSLEDAQAFTVTDDHTAQERVLADLPDWNLNPHSIRRALTQDEIETTDKRVRFVGIDAYLQAGGFVRQDLFNERGGGYVADTQLLNTLVMQKLQAAAANLKDEGWSWIEVTPDLDHQAYCQFDRRHPETCELSEQDQSELERLSGELDSLYDDEDADHSHQLAALQAAIDAIEAKSEYWSDDAKASAGVIVTIDYQGHLRIDRGLVHPDHAPEQMQELGIDRDTAATSTSIHSPKLTEDLTAHRTAAMAASMMAKPHIALAAVVHAMALSAQHRSSHSCLQISLKVPNLRNAIAAADDAKGLAVIETEHSRILDHIPHDPAALWQWCLTRSVEELLDLLALYASTSIDAVKRKGDATTHGRLAHAEALASSLALDMTEWFTPTADNYFKRITRPAIIAAIESATGNCSPTLANLKKTDLAKRAEQLVAGTGWLPELLKGRPNLD